MKVSDLIPDFALDWFTSEESAEEALRSEATESRYGELRAQHERLLATRDLFMGATALLDAKRQELLSVQEALVFAKTTEEMLRLQGKAQALYSLVKTPEEVERLIPEVEAQMKALTHPTPG